MNRAVADGREQAAKMAGIAQSADSDASFARLGDARRAVIAPCVRSFRADPRPRPHRSPEPEAR